MSARGMAIHHIQTIRLYMSNRVSPPPSSTPWGVGFTSYTAIMGHMGTDAAAANSVSAVARDLICCMCEEQDGYETAEAQHHIENIFQRMFVAFSPVLCAQNGACARDGHQEHILDKLDLGSQ